MKIKATGPYVDYPASTTRYYRIEEKEYQRLCERIAQLEAQRDALKKQNDQLKDEIFWLKSDVEELAGGGY